MPAGPMPLGFAYFVATKFAGYTAFCKWAIGSYVDDAIVSAPNPVTVAAPSVWKAGSARTLIGVAIGVTLGIGFWYVPLMRHIGDTADFIFFVLLVPVRVFEWWLLLRWIYKDVPFTRKDKLALIGMGILASFALDVVGVVSAFVIPGGMWVC